MPSSGAQSFAVKRAEVEFHNFASLGEPERAISVYAQENERRAAVIRNHLNFIGRMSPYLEIGANAGHTSYLLANEFGASGFALDISADALRYGIALMDRWGLSRAPVRLAGDAASLPFRDGSLRFVLAFQMLSQFMNMESVFLEVRRVLAPGGIFLFAEEPLLRLLSLRLYRAPYYNLMRPWERKLHDWGLLGYLVRDVIGAQQEDSFGIRQNHTMYLNDWHRLITRHFVAHEYDVFVPQRGWGERVVKDLAIRLDPHRSEWRAARLLGGTLAAVCRKAGNPDDPLGGSLDRFESFLRCSDCGGALLRDSQDTLTCRDCGYSAANEGGVYNLLRSEERAELYPGDRPDVIDFCLPNHEARLIDGFYELEGHFGGKYRWIGARAAAQLERVHPGPLRLRIRGHAHERSFGMGQPVKIEVSANDQRLPAMTLDRAGLFIYEADLPDAEDYRIRIASSPAWQAPPDDRVFTVNLGMLRLIPR
ncbi:MAG: class I SAM-dependent methyltransferase [Bryobacteraceae bacterium]